MVFSKIYVDLRCMLSNYAVARLLNNLKYDNKSMHKLHTQCVASDKFSKTFCEYTLNVNRKAVIAKRSRGISYWLRTKSA